MNTPTLFTDMSVCKGILQKMKELLAPGGKFVFAVDTVFDRCNEDSDYLMARNYCKANTWIFRRTCTDTASWKNV